MMTLREYCRREGITLGTGYRRIWNGTVKAERVDGRWIVEPEEEQKTDVTQDREAVLATA